MKLLVVIVTYNAMQWAERCFRSLTTSSLVPDVYVVDNGSSDGTQEFIKQHYPNVMFHQSKENLGFGKANNLGLQYAKDHQYDFVYLLNQDAWVFPETFEKIIDISLRNPEYGILSPFQMEANMEHLDSIFKRGVCSWKSSPNLLDDIYLKKNKEVIPVRLVMAAHWLIPRKCLLKVGGFSPTFPHYAEDNNYQDRIIFWGMKIGVTPSLRAVHDRENRVESKEKGIYLAYTQKLRNLSNPIEKEHFFKDIIINTIRETLRFRSFTPILYFFKIVKGLPMIRRNRYLSTSSDSAFLS